jgi:hypothetical protein
VVITRLRASHTPTVTLTPRQPPPAPLPANVRWRAGPRPARCDQDQVPAALVTGEQSNVRYYESLGFAVTGQVQLPGGGPAHWTMWRKPRQ